MGSKENEMSLSRNNIKPTIGGPNFANLKHGQNKAEELMQVLRQS